MEIRKIGYTFPVSVDEDGTPFCPDCRGVRMVADDNSATGRTWTCPIGDAELSAASAQMLARLKRAVDQA